MNNKDNTIGPGENDALELLLFQSRISEEEKRKMLVSLIKCNKTLYDGVITNGVVSNIKKSFLKEEDVKKVFEKYEYDFSLIKISIKKNILEYGSLSNIENVLDALDKNGYPKFNLKKDSKKVFSIVVGSSKALINDITKFAKKRHMSCNDILKISGILLKQDKESVDTSKLSNKKIEIYYLLKGCSDDFKRNVIDLEEHGKKIDNVFKNCSFLLTMSNELLHYNLEIFDYYSLNLNINGKDKCPLYVLSSLNTSSVIDQFIEVNRYGINYLRYNLSKLKLHNDPNSFFFFNMYESMKPVTLDNGENIIYGPFREDNNYHVFLKEEIERLSVDTRNVLYHGINDKNKYEITETIKFDCPNKKKYDKIIDNNKYSLIDEAIFDNNYINLINCYSDDDEPLIYNFDSIYISKLKVLRIYSILLANGIDNSMEAFIYAICYNTIISKENYDKLVKMIKEKIGE